MLILPEGDYGSTFGEDGKSKLQAWVREGGTLIGIGEALSDLTSSGLLDSKRENQPTPEKASKEKEDKPPVYLPISSCPYPPIPFCIGLLCVSASLRPCVRFPVLEAEDTEEHVADHRAHDAHRKSPQQELVEEPRAVLVDRRGGDAERSEGR